MVRSRFSRVEENKTKKRLFIVIVLTILIVILVFAVGIPLLVRVSALLGSINAQGQPLVSNDTTAPYAPILSPINDTTNNAKLTIEGFAEPETTLTLMVNGDKAKETLLGKEGTFTIEDVVLQSGKNSITAVATDKAGNASAESNTLVVNYKTKGPQLEVLEPADGQSFDKDHQEITVKGTTDKDAQVWINDRFVSVTDEGTFEHKLKLSDGENVLKIVAKDSAGNEKVLEKTVTYNP
ncbi:hypothetical protein C4579_01785 [Candidatus Microgenomates bacterium]|nr:MAG: hypothetical protein C4579_01785 [Candidatus Microgenomates bacterium]